LPDSFDVAWPRAEANAVQNMDDRLLIVGWGRRAVQSRVNARGSQKDGGTQGWKGTFPRPVHMSIRQTAPRLR
jgi:hypothetical protein